MAFLNRNILTAFCVLVALDSASAADAGAGYKLAPGDVVEIGIASIPERTQRAVIQMDGTIALAEVGMVPVGGLTPAELQAQMAAILPTKILHQRLPDGREQMIVVKPSDVTAIVAEYRPVYVTGDVLTPGQQAYRPLMTVRQAIAVSGGLSILRSRANQAGPDPVDLQRDYESLWGEYTRDYFHSARIRAELQDQASFDTSPPQGSPLSAIFSSAIAKAEAEALKLSLDNFQQEQNYVDQGAKDAAAQIDVLTKREQVENDGVKADEDDLARVMKLFQAGNLTNARLSDVRRSALLSSNGALQTSVELMRAKRQQKDYLRQRERNDNTRRIGLLNELKDTEVRLADTTARLHAASQKLQPAGSSALPLPVSGEAIQTQITIVRKVGEEWQKQAVEEDSEVLPGDTIEIRFASDLGRVASQ